MAMTTSPENPAPLHVISEQVGDWIKRLGPVWVEGQITQLNRRGGHSQVYLNVRDVDENVSVSVVTAPSVLDSLESPVDEGSRIIMHAKPEYWKGQGRLMFRAREIRAVGLGDLISRVAALQASLESEGLFDISRKRPLPFLPRKVGLICGRASAAEKDVIENAQRRWPTVEFEVREVAVQGVGAVAEVTKAVQELDALPGVDVIIITRGGGSFEDLLPFSDESLIRAVAAAGKPVISAIGHEQDNPILDFVADVRASTPTHAAALVVPDLEEQRQIIGDLQSRSLRAVVNFVQDQNQLIDRYRTHRALSDPSSLVADARARIEDLQTRSSTSLLHLLQTSTNATEHLALRLRTLSPASTLERGYSIVTDSGGKIVTTANQLTQGDLLNVRLASGSTKVEVKETNDD
ncbi:MAG: exodeoxyribonuclease VII large subunit [Candidatus Nanopelagicales bacterium]